MKETALTMKGNALKMKEIAPGIKVSGISIKEKEVITTNINKDASLQTRKKLRNVDNFMLFMPLKKIF